MMNSLTDSSALTSREELLLVADKQLYVPSIERNELLQFAETLPMLQVRRTSGWVAKKVRRESLQKHGISGKKPTSILSFYRHEKLSSYFIYIKNYDLCNHFGSEECSYAHNMQSNNECIASSCLFIPLLISFSLYVLALAK